MWQGMELVRMERRVSKISLEIAERFLDFFQFILMRCIGFEIFILAHRFWGPFKLKWHVIRYLRILRNLLAKPATSLREPHPAPLRRLCELSYF